MSSNNGTPWAIQEIDAAMMPPDNGGGKWWPLFREVALRLEQTPDNYALKIRLQDGGAASAKIALTRYANDRLGEGAIILTYERADDGDYVYARRGPNYK